MWNDISNRQGWGGDRASSVCGATSPSSSPDRGNYPRPNPWPDPAPPGSDLHRRTAPRRTNRGRKPPRPRFESPRDHPPASTPPLVSATFQASGTQQGAPLNVREKSPVERRTAETFQRRGGGSRGGITVSDRADGAGLGVSDRELRMTPKVSVRFGHGSVRPGRRRTSADRVRRHGLHGVCTGGQVGGRYRVPPRRAEHESALLIDVGLAVCGTAAAAIAAPRASQLQDRLEQFASPGAADGGSLTPPLSPGRLKPAADAGFGCRGERI